MSTPERNLRYIANHPDRVKANSTIQNAHRAEMVRLNPGLPHGLTKQQYDEMFANQGNACATCKRKDVDVWCVDHDHSCCAGSKGCYKCVRGILCKLCNSALGNIRDDSDTARGLISYLSGHAQESVLNRLGLA